MKPLLTICILIYSVLWLSASAQIAVGDSAIDFNLPDTSGNFFTLEDFAGDIILLNFFATWCPPCQIEAPQLEDSIWQVYQNQGVTVLGLDYQEPVSAIQNFANQFGLTYPILRDTTGSVFNEYGFTILPSNVLINRNGYVAWVEEGFNIPRFVHLIDSLLQLSSINQNQSVSNIPQALSIQGVYPNPFNSVTQIKFTITHDSMVRLRIFDITGREMILEENHFLRGENHWQLSINDNASGIYFYTIEAKNSTRYGKLVLQK